MRILTAIPVYNEARYVRDVLSEVRRYSDEILVVNDGSSDATTTILAAPRAGRPAGREMMVTPFASTGTAQQTAKSRSASDMLRLGMTSNSCMYGAPVTMALVPLITMPLPSRATTCT